MDTNLIVSEGLGFECGHVHLFITFALFAKGAVWQLATLVGHEVAALGEGQVVQVQQLSGGHALCGGRGRRQNQNRLNRASMALLSMHLVPRLSVM